MVVDQGHEEHNKPCDGYDASRLKLLEDHAAQHLIGLRKKMFTVWPPVEGLSEADVSQVIQSLLLDNVLKSAAELPARFDLVHEREREAIRVIVNNVVCAALHDWSTQDLKASSTRRVRTYIELTD